MLIMADTRTPTVVQKKDLKVNVFMARELLKGKPFHNNAG